MGLGANLVYGQRFDPETGQQFQRLVFCGHAGMQIADIIGVHVLVKAAVAQGVPVRLDLENQLNEPDALYGFPKGGGRLIRHSRADSADLLQLRAALRVLLLL